MLKRLLHMLSTIPTDAQLKNIYKGGRPPGQSGRFQTAGNMTQMINLHAKREGFLKTPGRSAFGRTIAKVNLRYFVLRGDTCSLQWWLTKQQAHSARRREENCSYRQMPLLHLSRPVAGACTISR